MHNISEHLSSVQLDLCDDLGARVRRQLVEVVLKDEFHPARVSVEGSGAERTGRLEAKTAVRDGYRHPVPATARPPPHY